ncbi:hypothetical protein NDI56_17695 [Haloarcula sp. S1CR25-12]|uniref:Uncharacterized protein n=1 Tax=Haloarcula saliterrae TaxID=2950534 RepID=A0ABU2FG49_9EURY|nr:hypothetical protein [Haloarcula sp. S1CR25-12]MDS0261237.1 hypothetical protein [Haloarcula sp. S1CR25-12]
MPEITVTETQRQRLESIQSDLEAAYIDTYGHIRTTDTVQYLLDTYTPPTQPSGEGAHERIATAEFHLLQEIAADVEGVPGSGIDTATMRGELLSTLGVEEFAARLAELDASEGPDADVGDSEAGDSDVDTDAEDGDAADSDDTSTDEPTAAGDEPTESDGDGDADGGSEAGESGGDADTADSTPNTDGPGAVLSAANQLLKTHDDKWRKSGGNEPYEVDLPDGTTEAVRTKDDIRGLLFKHY